MIIEKLIVRHFKNRYGKCEGMIIEKMPSGKKIRISFNNDATYCGGNCTVGEYWRNEHGWTEVYRIDNHDYEKERQIHSADCFEPKRDEFNYETFLPYIDHVKEIMMQILE